MVLNNNPLDDLDLVEEKTTKTKIQKNSFNYSKKEMGKFLEENKEGAPIPLYRRKSEATILHDPSPLKDRGKKKATVVIHKKIKYYDEHGMKILKFN